jgi:hypothetical protein
VDLEYCGSALSRAMQIVDLYHAQEHRWDVARKLYPGDEAAQKRWLMHKLDWFESGKIEKLVAALRKLAEVQLVKAIRIEAECFDRNRERIRYPEFRGKNLFVGSGVIEAGCKPRSVPVSSNPACSGPFVVPTQSLLSIAAVAAANLGVIGRRGRPDCTFMSHTS